MVHLMSIVQPNTANIATTMNNNSHMLSTNNAENSSGSSSRNEHNYAPNPSKFTNDAEYYRYVMNQLSGKGRASSSTDISKPTRYYNNNQMNSYDPFVEDSSGRSTGIENEYWGNNNLEEDGNAEEDAEDEEGPFPYASFMDPLTPRAKQAKSKALARKEKSNQGVVDSTYGSDKGKTVVRYYDRPNSRLSSSNKAVPSTTQDKVMTSDDVDGPEMQDARHSGQHQSARSSYSVKRDLVVWDVHWDQLMLMNLVSKIRQYGLDPILQEAVGEMSQTLSVDGYMQHFTKLYCLRKKCGMKLPKLPPGQSEPTMTETTASMNLLLPQEGLHLRLKALEKQFKEEKEEKDSGLAREINDDGDFEPSRNNRFSMFTSFSRAEMAAINSKRCLAHFKKNEKKLDEAVEPSSSRRGPGRPRKSYTGQIWWTAENDNKPVEANFSSGHGNNMVSIIPAGRDADAAPTTSAAPAAPSVPERPMRRFVPTVPPTPVPDPYYSVHITGASGKGMNETATPKKVTRKKSFPVKEWLSDKKKRNTPTGQTVAAQEVEDTPLKKFRIGNSSTSPKELVRSEDAQQNPTPSKISSGLKFFGKRRQAAKAEKINSKPAEPTAISFSYPQTQTVQPPVYQNPLPSDPVQVQTSQVVHTHHGTEHLKAHPSEPNLRGTTLQNNISGEGLMIQNWTAQPQHKSDYNSNVPKSCEIVLDPKVVASVVRNIERAMDKTPENQLNEQFQRELSLEDGSRVDVRAEKRQQVESTEIFRLGDPNFAREMNARSHETSHVAGGPTEASRKKLNNLPSIDSVINQEERKTPIELKLPPVPRRSDARPPYSLFPPVRQPQQAMISNISPAKVNSPSHKGNSPLLTREMKNTPYYPYIPAESTPIAPSEEWQQNTNWI